MTPRLDLVLMWHMHQPDYRDYATGEYTQPWVYLHAIKDYGDMAAHLERHTRIHAVVNLVPVLLDQLEDYAEQYASGRIRDPLLRLLQRDEQTPLSDADRRLIIDRCFAANHEKMVEPYAPYRRLLELHHLFNDYGSEAQAYLSDHYFYDLLVWYHLAWTGETVRRNSEIVTRLMSEGTTFSAADRHALYDLIGEVVTGIVPRYAALARQGRIELTTTPHFHPLAPLMLDFASAREARPSFPLPATPRYPGGQARVQFHIDSAMREHTRRFGSAPLGVWPAEGAVSAGLVDLLGRSGCAWTASSEAVLAQSLQASRTIAVSEDWPAQRARWLYRPWRQRSGGPVMFFRDDRLSDLIGFEYAKWHSRDAALNFIAELDGIATRTEANDTPLVSVILDGENCWEYYPYNGFYFLEALYAALEGHAAIRTTTFKAAVEDDAHKATPLDRLVAGSWVHGDFGTWIGSRDKNLAWDLLSVAKRCFDLVIGGGRLNESECRAAYRQLASCESSDWFWWMGDYNPPAAVAEFDRLYRANLTHLYELLKLPPPHALSVPISHGSGEPEGGGAMRRAT
jgi:alpha-amylase/alpha-mannosidase (GH57 family)